MGLESVDVSEHQLSRLLADGLKEGIAQSMQEQLEAELVPVLKARIADHIKETMKNFVNSRLSVYQSHMDLNIQIMFAPKMEAPK